MEISLRSQMAAGVAVAGAAAIAVTPIVQQDMVQSLRQVAADVQLTWVNPVSELARSLNLGTDYLFATDTGPFPFLQGQVLRVIQQEPSEHPTLYVIGQGATAPLGWIPQLLGGWTYTTKIYEDEAGTQPAPPPFDTVTTTPIGGFPLASAVGTNLSGYIDAAVRGLSGLVSGVGAAAFAVPFAAVQIVADLIGGQTPDLQAILDEIVAPITDGLETAVAAATYLLTTITTRITTALPLLPAVGIALAQQAFGSAVYLGTELATTFGDAIGNLPDVELAFDTVVNGLVGPTGFVGDVVELTVGRGVATGDSANPFIPSVRSVVSGVTGGSSQVIVNPTVPSALAGAAVDPAGAAVDPVSAEPAADVDAAIARVAVEEDKTTTSDSRGAVSRTRSGGNTVAATADSDDSAPKPAAKQRASRSARR